MGRGDQYPVHGPAAYRAIEHEVWELAYEVYLDVQKSRTEHLGVDDDRLGAVEADVDRSVDPIERLAASER